MDKPRYVDPNSGAAPQPGGAAGFLAQQRGHAVVAEQEENSEFEQIVSPDGLTVYPNDPQPPSHEVFNEEDVRKFNEEERVALKEYETQAAGAAVGDGEETEARDEGDQSPREPGEGADGKVRSDSERADLKAVELQAAGPLVDEGDGAEGEAGDSSEEGDGGESDAYDPSEHTVEEVNDYLEANPDQRDAVVAAEREGKGRKGITGDE